MKKFNPVPQATNISLAKIELTAKPANDKGRKPNMSHPTDEQINRAKGIVMGCFIMAGVFLGSCWMLSSALDIAFTAAFISAIIPFGVCSFVAKILKAFAR